MSLAARPDPAREAERPVAVALLAAGGPRAILGPAESADGLAASIAPGPRTLFGPRGAVVNPTTGALAVADTGHHRLMIWRGTPTTDYAPADFQIGQRDFSSEGRNGKGAIGPATLNVPTGLATDGRRLAVADAWNHRVLIWHVWPEEANQPADLVLGQKDFTGGDANRGGHVAADTLNWCYGVSFLGDRLAVADTGNRRVLIWNNIPRENGQPADIVLGQLGFDGRDENAGRSAGSLGMRWPHGIAVVPAARSTPSPRMQRNPSPLAGEVRRGGTPNAGCESPPPNVPRKGGGNASSERPSGSSAIDGAHGPFLISDAGNNRVMAWEGANVHTGAPCDFLLGQKSMSEIEHNRGRYLPDASALNMPYGLCVAEDWLIAADTANSRLVGWRLDDLAMDAPASALAGQPHFGAKGDNRWRAAERDSLCWPYGVTASGGLAAIADSGNNRVLLWEIAP